MIKSSQLDPLFVIFEQHLLNFQDPGTDRKTFICGVISDYLGYLRKKNITVPGHLEQHIVEELAAQVNTMLVKRIYGCLNLDEYLNKAPKRACQQARRRARTRYNKLNAA